MRCTVGADHLPLNGWMIYRALVVALATALPQVLWVDERASVLASCLCHLLEFGASPVILFFSLLPV